MKVFQVFFISLWFLISIDARRSNHRRMFKEWKMSWRQPNMTQYFRYPSQHGGFFGRLDGIGYSPSYGIGRPFKMHNRFKKERNRSKLRPSFLSKITVCASTCSGNCTQTVTCHQSCVTKCENVRVPQLCKRNCNVNECQTTQTNDCTACYQTCWNPRQNCRAEHCELACRRRANRPRRSCRRCMDQHCASGDEEETTEAEQIPDVFGNGSSDRFSQFMREVTKLRGDGNIPNLNDLSVTVDRRDP